MAPSSPRFTRIDPLVAESRREGKRIRFYVRDGSPTGRIIEAIVIEVLESRDGRPRLRLAIPTGSGDPVEIRVLLESITSVERMDDDPQSPASISGTRIARPTMGYGEAAPLRLPKSR